MKSLVVILSSVAFAQVVAATGLTADFTVEKSDFRRALHSSGFAPRITSFGETFNDVKSLNFEYSRTHDHALVNDGQRIFDVHFIFPLMHLDAKDPNNYFFKATDHAMKRMRDAGLKVFYRLGTSIEHSGPTVHFNSLIPEDFDKMAEVFAATVRHYNKGWANGFYWDIKYWEIWNEPNIFNSMWCLPDGDNGDGKRELRQKLFVEFFVKCLKRLKSEFPDIKVGGPALADYHESYFRAIFDACKKEGIEPDFVSWHHYGHNLDTNFKAAEELRRLCDSYGFTKCELILNEWHYLGDYSWGGLASSDPKDIKKVWHGPASHNGIDSSIYTLSHFARFQSSVIDQAYFYGCSHTGNWGYMNGHKEKYKIWYALKLYAPLAANAAKVCASSNGGSVTTLALKSADGKTGWLLVSDYRGKERELTLDVKGVGKIVSATLLDHERNNEPCEVKFENGKLHLKKELPGSAAFLVTFAID